MAAEMTREQQLAWYVAKGLTQAEAEEVLADVDFGAAQVTDEERAAAHVERIARRPELDLDA